MPEHLLLPDRGMVMPTTVHEMALNTPNLSIPPPRDSPIPPSGVRSAVSPLRIPIGKDERDRIVCALEICSGNQSKAADLLGISRRTMVKRLDVYGIPRPRKDG